jgi:predicted dehydrogenase
MMTKMERRTFILTTGATALQTQLAAGANDRVNVAVVGTRSRGRDHIDIYARQPGSAVAAVCDVDNAQNERAVALIEKAEAPRAKIYQDYRKLLEDKSIDAVSLATCNHWHALGTIWACQAGKDVYVEKPASHNIWEGRKMIEAASKYNRIVQVGMQSRTIEHKQKAVELLRQGLLGKLYLAKGICYKRRKSIGKSPDGPVPAGVDYEQWLGPAPMRPFNPNRFHYNWHWFWDTGNGDIANQGVHEMDIARWGLGKQGLPNRITSSGGKYAYDDDQETPNTQLASFEYDDCQIVFEVRGLFTAGEGSVAWDGSNYIGNIFYGSEGFMSLDSTGFQVFLGEKRELAQSMKATEAKIWDTGPHIANFLDCVRSRKAGDLRGSLEDGHVSAALCHLANISHRLGRQVTFNPKQENFGTDYEANQMLSRDYRAPYVVPSSV